MSNPTIGGRLDDYYLRLYNASGKSAKELLEYALDIIKDRPDLVRELKLEKINLEKLKLNLEQEYLENLLKNPIDFPDDDYQKYTGYIYFISNGESVKIGFSKDPEKRLKNLQTANPVELKLLYFEKGNSNIESRLHKLFSKDRIQGEWFNFSDEILEFIDSKRGCFQ